MTKPQGIGRGNGPKLRRTSVRMPALPDALCRDSDPLLWIGEDVSRDGLRSDVEPPRVREAKAICRRCTDRLDCGLWAIEQGEHGIWGGLDDSERAQIRAQIRSVA